jgi:hypothetical protein
MKLLLALAMAFATLFSASAFCAPCALQTRSVTSFTGPAVAAREVVASESSLRMMVRASSLTIF